jgi:iron complex outermembrane recepter protein
MMMALESGGARRCQRRRVAGICLLGAATLAAWAVGALAAEAQQVPDAARVVSEAGHPAESAATNAGVVRIRGVVLDASGRAPVAGVRVRVVGGGAGAVTDRDGRFVVEVATPGRATLVFEGLGRRTERREVVLPGAAEAVLEVLLVEQAVALDPLVVTATREAERLSRTAASVGAVAGTEIREERPSHPSQIMGRIPGVLVSVTGGEGHMTAIRQPLTTDPVYLYLEDGIPIRSTGFFNHNALYEINVPQAERIEVVKGPATALYGSDAIGATINVETRPAAAAPGLGLSVESGDHGYLRALASYAVASPRQGVRADLNVTRTDGWRQATGYDRQSLTARWDRELGGSSTIRAVAAFSRIDQETAGSSRLPQDLYEASPTANLTPISFREVTATRLSAAYERPGERSLLSLTTFARSNAMDILPNWSLTFDPVVSRTANRSLGLLARYRRELPALEARLITGVDVDWSPGERFERRIQAVREDGVFTRYEEGDPLYDYDVTFLGVSPYLHAEASPVARLRLTGGLRLDRLGYAYRDRLGELQTGRHRRPASTDVDYTQLSPKAGLTVDLGRGSSAFLAWSRGFRAPSEGQLFRQGPAASTVDLEPVRATNREAGLRGTLGPRVRYELAAYSMVKTNDIVQYQRADDVRETQNAGRSRHSGVELALRVALPADLHLATALAWGRHEYLSWQPTPDVDLSGHEMESAPRTTASARLGWAPGGSDGRRLSLEWTRVGPYWLDAANTERYPGHELLTLGGALPVSQRVALFARVQNLTDARYAESGGWSAVRGRELAPGLPRTLHAGVELRPR